jgi:hypothetical protein
MNSGVSTKETYEEEEILTVLDFLQKHKKYTKTVALGECYSTYLFTKIQADLFKETGKGPFTHIILDSPWHSFKSFAESICSDPYLPFSPQEGGAPWILKKFTNSPAIKWLLLKIAFAFLQNVSIEEPLAQLNIPVLFIHGCNDIFVPENQFKQIWDASPQEQRAALLTPYSHSDNLHTATKHIYRFICEQFIKSSSIKNFLENCAEVIE